MKYRRGGFVLRSAVSLLLLTSCSVNKQISKSAKETVLTNKAFLSAHTGISIFEPATGKTWYDYQGDKYFVPASNTKLPTCYAAMKYLGDSLVGARIEERWDGVSIYGTGDPTFLHPDFKYQPVFDYAKSKRGSKVTIIENQSYELLGISNNYFKYRYYGKGWNWDDYGESYMPEKSFFPIYGNVVRVFIDKNSNLKITPAYFKDYDWWDKADTSKFEVSREQAGNQFYISGSKHNSTIQVPFKTTSSYHVEKFVVNIIAGLLTDTLGYKIVQATTGPQLKRYKAIYSQPTDTVLKLMMHRSDNFFAEQTLLMVSNERMGYMFTDKIIDTLLKTDFKDLPQKPRWADGSGLSRYNLFSPRDFVMILDKMRNEFGMDRMKVILATGGEGTISSYYKTDSGYIYGKTGTLSGVVAFSGYLYTKKGKLLIFSTLINNHQSSATDVRRAIEKFLQGIRNNY